MNNPQEPQTAQPTSDEPWGIRDSFSGFQRTFRTEYERDQFYGETSGRFVLPELFGPPCEQLRECINSGQVSAAQVVAHAEAGELPEPFGFLLPTIRNPEFHYMRRINEKGMGVFSADQMRAALAAERAEVARLRAEIEAIREDASEWSRYIIEDNAPLSLENYIEREMDRRAALIDEVRVVDASPLAAVMNENAWRAAMIGLCQGPFPRTPDEAANHLRSRLHPPSQPAASDERSCTCHPDDNPPVPCAKKYAIAECCASVATPVELPVVAWRRAWEGDVSDLCHWLYADEYEPRDDNPNWDSLVRLSDAQAAIAAGRKAS